MLLLLALPLVLPPASMQGGRHELLSKHFSAYALLKLAPVVVTMAFVAVERRHLMVRP